MSRIACLVIAAATILLPRCATGQCPLQWQAREPIPSVRGDAHASLVWDPDGAGPAPAVLVVGGRFDVGTMLETTLATWDGTQWGALGAPPFTEIEALTVWNGLLVAAGTVNLTQAVATWNGTAWSVIGSTSGQIEALAVFNGDLFVGGNFGFMNNVTTHCLARWNGTAWSEPGGGVTGRVRALAVLGSLWVGGSLTQAGAVPVNKLAAWNGSTWTPGGPFDDDVRCLAVGIGSSQTNSFLFAGGDFTTVAATPAQHIARFSPSTGAWSAIPGLPGDACRTIHVRGTGLTTYQLHAGVEDSLSAEKVWRQNGTTWQSLGIVFDDNEPNPTSLAFFNGQYIAAFAGSTFVSTPLLRAVRVHDGTVWQPVSGPGFDSRIFTVLPYGGDVVVGGVFTRYGTTSLGGIARGGPGAWQPLGGGVAGGGGVFALCRLPNGDLVAGGEFTTAGGIAAANIARWDGAAWHALGLGTDQYVSDVLALPDGSLIAAGLFTHAGGVACNYVARWDGIAWSPLGAGMNSTVYGLARRSNGEIFASGSFSLAGGVSASGIARWNGTSWSALGSGISGSGIVTVLADDSVVAGGSFTLAGSVFSPSVARWDGSAWNAQSTPTAAWDGLVMSLVALPNGDYIAGGAVSTFGSGPSAMQVNLARHVGGPASVQWNALDVRGFAVDAAALMPNGDVVLVGEFDSAGGAASRNLAVLRPTCPATAVAYGSGCTGSGGANVLAATSLPWAGGTFRARASGMPAVALALVVTGFSQLSVPMPAVLPQGVAGCTVLVSPDLLDVALPNGGVVTTQIGIPTSVSLAGQSFHHQVVPLEMDLAGNILAITSTNALTLTIGVL